MKGKIMSHIGRKNRFQLIGFTIAKRQQIRRDKWPNMRPHIFDKVAILNKWAFLGYFD